MSPRYWYQLASNSISRPSCNRTFNLRRSQLSSCLFSPCDSRSTTIRLLALVRTCRRLGRRGPWRAGGRIVMQSVKCTVDPVAIFLLPLARLHRACAGWTAQHLFNARRANKSRCCGGRVCKGQRFLVTELAGPDEHVRAVIRRHRQLFQRYPSGSSNGTAIPVLNSATRSLQPEDRHDQPECSRRCGAVSTAAAAPTTPAANTAPVKEGEQAHGRPNIKLKGVEITDCDTLVVEGSVEATMDSRGSRFPSAARSGFGRDRHRGVRGHFEGISPRAKLVIYAKG